MTDEIENHTIRLLQEMRGQIEGLAAEVRSRFDAMEERFTDQGQRTDGNTLVFNLVAGVVHQHEERITDLEQRER